MNTDLVLYAHALKYEAMVLRGEVVATLAESTCNGQIAQRLEQIAAKLELIAGLDGGDA